MKEEGIYTSNFLKFWESYPNKVGKGAAFKSYNNILNPKPQLSDILNSIQTHLKTEQWQTKKFIPHPATWLNQRRWEDELDAEGNKPKTLMFRVPANDR